MIVQQRFAVVTRARSTTELSPELERAVRSSGIRRGLLNVFVQHTSASLILCENADPDVRGDLETLFARLAPDGDPAWRHDSEGEDDMAAHARSVLTTTSLAIPIADGRLALGTWQGVYLWEHRARGHERYILLTLIGE